VQQANIWDKVRAGCVSTGSENPVQRAHSFRCNKSKFGCNAQSFRFDKVIFRCLAESLRTAAGIWRCNAESFR
jgi:hypothetical protein